MYTKAIRGALLILFFVTLSLSALQWFYPWPEESTPTFFSEMYDPGLAHLASVDQAICWLDSTAADRGIKPSSRAYVDLADMLMRKRFFHGYSHYRFSDDYISYLLGRVVWTHLSAIVEPDDILKFSHAACSQQAIVFMALLKKKGYQTRKVGLRGHFCTGVFYDGGWHFYDSNKEPNFSNDQPIPSASELIANKNLLYLAYQGILSKNQVDEMFSKVELVETKILPGHRVRVMHKITHFLSHFAWAAIWLGYLLSFVFERFLSVKHVRYQRVPVIR